MTTIKVDYDACNGCRMCFKVCYVDVWRYDDEQDMPIVAYPEDCTPATCASWSARRRPSRWWSTTSRPWPPVIERGFPYVPGKAEI